LSAVIEYGGCEVQPGFCDGGAGCPLSSSTVGADVLSTEPGGAASGDSIGGGRRSYKRPAPLLQAPSGAATFLRQHCYFAPAALLRAPSGGGCYFPPAALLLSSSSTATLIRRRCYKRPAAAATILRRRCYKRPAALLQLPGDAATFLRRRCYNCPAALLQLLGDAATFLRRTIVRQRCYKRPADSKRRVPVLQSWRLPVVSVDPAMVDCWCYTGLPPLLRPLATGCCKG
jgi:hypothetical protein